MTTELSVRAPKIAPKRVRRAAAGTIRGRMRRPAVYLSVGFLLLLVVVALLAETIAPYDYAAQDLQNQLQPWSSEHWLGTDHLGRDVLSRLMYATRLTLLAPLLSVGIALLIALPTGLFAGYARGWVDQVTSRVAEVFLALPGLVFALVIVAILGRGLFNAMLALGIAFAPGLFRVVRAATLGVAGETYIESSRSIGSSTLRTVFVHVVPNIMAPLVVQVTILMGIAIIAESALSFIGVGAQPPAASLGSMLRDAYDFQFRAPLAVLPPGILLMVTVLCFNTLGDRFRDALLGEQR
ncbi:ABC transporter permease [Microbacterium sp. PA5]|uniref:ABC transporter permease n=1 Tax=Microbacterium sp. PA5 TaxID=3416654 RepID=UPI003CF811C2